MIYSVTVARKKPRYLWNEQNHSGERQSAWKSWTSLKILHAEYLKSEFFMGR